MKNCLHFKHKIVPMELIYGMCRKIIESACYKFGGIVFFFGGNLLSVRASGRKTVEVQVFSTADMLMKMEKRVLLPWEVKSTMIFWNWKLYVWALDSKSAPWNSSSITNIVRCFSPDMALLRFSILKSIIGTLPWICRDVGILNYSSKIDNF